MPTTRLRRPVLSSLVATALAACGGAAPGSDTTPAPSEPAAGTSGLPGLDWGATSEAVLAAYPTATPTAGGLSDVGAVEGRTASTTFTIGATGLARANVDWTDTFPSMQDCAATWATLRATLDGRFGPSQSDNLAAYWTTATASITLACNPDDSGAAALSLSYAAPAP